jgi:dimethylamine monooxygenase subunit A
MTLARTPYDGSATPFTIGLKPLDPDQWIEPDGRLADQLSQKKRLYEEDFETVFAAEPGTREAQAEVLAMLADYLPSRFPDIYRRHDDRIDILPAGRSLHLGEWPQMPLVAASLLVQEDLVIMSRGNEGWRLVAAALCFPSSWSLAEKFGLPLHEIHIPVPGFGDGTRNARLIDRIFDNLAIDRPVERMNWSLQEDDRLHLPRSKGQRDEAVRHESGGLLGIDPLARAFIRVERQTLRKLPLSGDILFTIRIHLDPMRLLAEHPDRARLTISLADQLAAMDTAQLDYKGILANRDRLVHSLREMAQTG